MPIIDIEIENYRGVGQRQTLKFAKPDGTNPASGITVIVGPNNSGKSTVLRAVDAMYSGETTFVAETEDRRGTTFPYVKVQFESDGHRKIIETKTVDRSAYLEKTGSLQEATDRCRFIPARRPWRDRFSRQVGYTAATYELQTQSSRKHDEFYIDNQFANALYAIERTPNAKEHFLKVLKFLEPTIVDFWIDRSHGQDYLAFESASGFAHRAGIVGEGVSNIFRLCYGLISQTENELLLIDEPELSLHPQSQRQLYRLLAHRGRDRQIVVSTHSVHFVDWGHISSGTKIYRANAAPAHGSTFQSISSDTIKVISGIADRDIKNRRAYDVLAKEVFFSRGCVLVEGYEDAHLLQKYFEDNGMQAIEIVGYGSGGADGIVAWLSACCDLGIPAVGLFDRDAKGNAAIEVAKAKFNGIEQIRLLQIPTPDIRDKHKLEPDCKTESEEIDKEGMFTKDWALKTKYKGSMEAIAADISYFLHPQNEIPSLSPPV